MIAVSSRIVVVFPGAVGPHQPEDFPFRHRQIETIDGREVAESFRQTLDADGGHKKGLGMGIRKRGRRNEEGR